MARAKLQLGALLCSCCLVLLACHPKEKPHPEAAPSTPGSQTTVELIVLGTVQDGGAPHLGCEKTCCTALLHAPDPSLKITSLGLVDHELKQYYLFEASPDIAEQLGYLQGNFSDYLFSGILLTHAHMGHYAGLLQLGREAMNSSKIPVFVMPRMAEFLKENGPWEQLLKLDQIQLFPLESGVPFALNANIRVKPLQVPHRDEYSETVGFQVSGPGKSFIFIPDIDKWDRWDTPVEQLVATVDLAFLDGTFYNGAELDNRDMSEIPHPSVEESMALFERLEGTLRSRVHFIHLNHTNPLLHPESEAYNSTLQKGFRVAQFGNRHDL